MSRRVTDPEIVQRLIVGLDGLFDDDQYVHVSAKEGGVGSTSASVSLTLQDADTGDVAIFRVSITRPEPGDDDYDGEDD